MSTPLVILACILAFFAMVLIPLMMCKSAQPQNLDQQQVHAKQGRKVQKRKKKK